MKKIHTHYDNLNVARNAPPEVIQAAYRALCRKYHPDFHPDDPEAARIMTIVNAAYAVLSDPVKRAEHDAWIARREAELAREGEALGSRAEDVSRRESSAPWERPGPGPREPRTEADDFRSPWAERPESPPPGSAGRRDGGKKNSHVRRNWFFYLIAAAVVWKLFTLGAPEQPDQLVDTSAEAPAVKSSGHRRAAKRRPARQTDADRAAADSSTTDTSPASANGAGADKSAAPAPAEDGGDKPAAAVDRCRIVLDNEQGRALSGRLMRLEKGGRARQVRAFAIPARGAATVRNIPPGSYEVRYRNAATGKTGKTDAFTLHEAREADGVHADSLTFTIEGDSHGASRTAPVGVVEF